MLIEDYSWEMIGSKEKMVISVVVSTKITLNQNSLNVGNSSFPKDYHFDMVGGPSTLHDPKSDAGGSLSSWQGHPSR
jgi:hypothetical protein